MPLRRLQVALGNSIRTLLSGSPSKKFIPDPTQPGLFPHDSAAFVVHAEASMMIGGIRALLLQSLHPVAMFAVSEHSDFRNDPLARLRRTVHFLGTTTYGTLSEAQAALDEVKRIHKSVKGITPEGVAYSADEQHLLSWVHATEVDSFLTAYQIYRRRRRRKEVSADAYVSEMAVVAEALGDAHPPRNFGELRKLLEEFRPTLANSELSREAARFLRNFPFGGWTRIFYVLLFEAAADLLPDWAKDMHCFRKRRGGQRLLRIAARMLIGVLGWALEGPDVPLEDAAATRRSGGSEGL